MEALFENFKLSFFRHPKHSPKEIIVRYSLSYIGRFFVHSYWTIMRFGAAVEYGTQFKKFLVYFKRS